MFNSMILAPRPSHGRPAGLSLLASWLMPVLAVLFCFLFSVAVAPASSAREDCNTDLVQVLESNPRSHRLSPETGYRDANQSPLPGSSTENKPLRLLLQREVSDDRVEALKRAVHADEIRRGIVMDKLRRRSLLSSDSLASNASTQLTSLVISGASVGAGEYFVSLSFGTPPQNLYLIADTGSDLTWVKCAALCSGECSSTNRSFNPDSSTSFQRVPCISRLCATSFFPLACDPLSGACGFESSYSDESFVSGDLASESVTLGSSSGRNVKVDNLLIGCGRQYAGASFQKAGGVIGLGQGSLSLSSQLAEQSYANMFSYCLVDFLGPSWSKGSLAFGDTIFPSTLQYTPLLKNPFAETYYYVGLEEIAVAGRVLSIPSSAWNIDFQGNGGTIVDSGTTLAKFVEPAYAQIRSAFQQSIQYPSTEPVAGLDLCYNVIGISDVRFPEFSITLQGNLTLNLPQNNYFTQVTNGITCLAMLGVPLPGFSVLGNLMQQNYNVQFDRLHNRVGFAPTNCSSLQE